MFEISHFPGHIFLAFPYVHIYENESQQRVSCNGYLVWDAEFAAFGFQPKLGSFPHVISLQIECS